jgi:hypothetical protein
MGLQAFRLKEEFYHHFVRNETMERTLNSFLTTHFSIILLLLKKKSVQSRVKGTLDVL